MEKNGTPEPSHVASQGHLWTAEPEREPYVVTEPPRSDLVVPESVHTLRKNVAIIHCSPVKVERSQNLNNRRLVDALILFVQLDMKVRGEHLFARVRDERLSPLFEARISDLARLGSIPGKNFERLYKDLKAIYETDFRWNVVGDSKEVEWESQAHLLSYLAIGNKKNAGKVRFAFDPFILTMIVQPSIWASISLQPAPGLTTSPSYALYQNCWRYVTTQRKVTAELPLSMWVELLVGPESYVTIEPDGSKTVNYADFKRKVLNSAIEIVNNNIALSYKLELKEGKSGRRVTSLQFKFIPKENRSEHRILLWDKDIVNTLKNIGFSTEEIHDMSESLTMEQIAESIARLQEGEARLKDAGSRIISRKSYFTAIITNLTKEFDFDLAVTQRFLEEEQKLVEQRAADDRKKRLESEYEEHRFKTYVSNLFALDEYSRIQLLDQFEASKEGRAAEVFVKKGWTTANRPALSVLRKWIMETQPEVFRSLLPNPQDQSFEAWMAWKLEQAMR